MAESNKGERRVHFRGKARAGRRVELTYETIDERGHETCDSIEGVTSNIGVGGAFILKDEPFEIGTRLRIKLRVPTAELPIAVEGEVRWVVTAAQNQHGAGMGVKFYGLDVEALLKLSEYFASLTGVDA
jgi:uncharacterized protein (TIGR02266 family)